MLHYRTKDDTEDRLKIEMSYRNPLPQNRVSVLDGIKYASVDYLIESKTQDCDYSWKVSMKELHRFDVDLVCFQNVDGFFVKRYKNFDTKSGSQMP